MKIGKDYIGVGCGALIINEHGQTLLLKRTSETKSNAGQWSKPGGTVEFGETVQEAIIREIKEELDVTIHLLDFLGYTDHIIPEEDKHWVAFHYLAKIVKGEPCNMEPTKHEEIRWFGFDELPEDLTITTREPIEKYLAGLNKIWTIVY